MEKLKQQLLKQKKWLRCCILLCLLLYFSYNSLGELLNLNPPERMVEFQSGLLIGVCLICFLRMFVLSKALRNDTTSMQVYYNELHDERKALIRLKAGVPFIIITSGCLIFASFIAGFYNEVVSFTIIGAVFFQLLASVVVKFYLLKRG